MLNSSGCSGFCRAGRLEWRGGARQGRGERRGGGAARAVSGAVLEALPRDLDQLLAVVEGVDRLLAVAAGYDDHLRAESVDHLGQMLWRLLLVAAGEDESLGQIRSHNGRARQDQLP